MTHKGQRTACRGGWLVAVWLGPFAFMGLAAPPALAQPGTTIALTGAVIIDGTGRPPVDSSTLLVADGRVRAIGPHDNVPVPDGATRIDLSGKTIIPGLITTHAHLNDGDETAALRDQLLAQLETYGQYGVTTVHTLGDGRSAAYRAHDPEDSPHRWQVAAESIRIRDEQADGEWLDRARLFVSGPNVVGRTIAEARAGVDRIADLGVDIIKTRLDARPDDMTRPVFEALIDHAHARGLRVVAHAVALDDTRGLAEAGVDVIAHSVRDQDVTADVTSVLARSDVGYIATLTRNLSLFLYDSTPPFFTDPFFLRGAPAYGADMARVQDPAFQTRVRTSPQAQEARRTLAQAQRNVKRLADGGVRVALGTDSGTQVGRWQGYFEHVELELMVEAGLTPMQTIVAATGDAARVMHLDHVGTLEPGKWADFIVLNADPLVDITNTRQIHAVWVAGRPLAVSARTAAGAARTPKLLLIGIDGVRPDVMAEVPTPHLDALAAEGVFVDDARTTLPSISGPSWSSMLTGVWPDKHGVTDNDFTTKYFDRYPDFLTRIEQVRPELSTAVIADWMPLVQAAVGLPIISDAVDLKRGLDGYELGWTEADQRVTDLAVERLTTSDPDALFVYLGSPDETSHEHRSIGEEYRAAIELTDRHVGRLVAAVRARESYGREDWFILASTDHGRRVDGGHGRDSPEEMTIFVLAHGATATNPSPGRQVFIVDIAPTALMHLGVAIRPEWRLDGKSMAAPVR